MPPAQGGVAFTQVLTQTLGAVWEGLGPGVAAGSPSDLLCNLSPSLSC